MQTLINSACLHNTSTITSKYTYIYLTSRSPENMSNFFKAWLPIALLLLSGNAAAFDVQRLTSGLTLRDATWLSGAGAWDAGMCTGLIGYKGQVFTGGGCVSVALYDNIDQRIQDRKSGVSGWDIPDAYAPWCMDGSNAVANTGGVNFGYDWAFGDTGKDSAYLVLGQVETESFDRRK